MMLCNVRKPEEMIDYLVDCTLATVVDLAMASKLRKGEFERQCSIAQAGINFLGRDYPFTSRRAKAVIESKKTCLEFYTEFRKTARS